MRPYVLTEHAKNVIAERSIQIAWIEQVLDRPKLVELDSDDPQLTHHVGRIQQYGNRALRGIEHPGNSSTDCNGIFRPEDERQIVKLKVDEKADALYLRLDDSEIVESEEVSAGIVLDFNERVEWACPEQA